MDINKIKFLEYMLNSYVLDAVRRYEEQQRHNKRKTNERTISKIEKEAFAELTHEYPELYDYYIRLRELDSTEIRKISTVEVSNQLEKFLENTNELIHLVITKGYKINETLSAREEAIQRLRFFKHVIEDCDGYKNFYSGGIRISSEDDIRRMFRLVWYDTTFKVDFDTNNGRGEADVIVSKGQYNKNITEFKLASNSYLPHVFEQVKVYEAANCADGSLVAIFYFSEKEFEIVKNVVKVAGYEEQVNKSVFLIDCRRDNKPSASKTK